MVGVTEQTPVLPGQAAPDAEYHVLILFPVLSLTHREYQVALGTAFQLYVGVLVTIVPDGATSVALPGEVGTGAVNAMASLQGP